MSWQQVGSNEELVPGEIYRATFYIKGPWSRFAVDAMTAAIRTGVGLRNLDPFHKLHSKISIRSITYELPTVSERAGSRSNPWPLKVEFRKTNNQSAVLIILGLIALIIVATIALQVSGKKMEHLVTTVSHETQDTLKRTLNPGVILAAFVIGALFLVRR